MKIVYCYFLANEPEPESSCISVRLQTAIVVFISIETGEMQKQRMISVTLLIEIMTYILSSVTSYWRPLPLPTYCHSFLTPPPWSMMQFVTDPSRAIPMIPSSQTLGLYFDVPIGRSYGLASCHVIGQSFIILYVALHMFTIRPRFNKSSNLY